MSGQRTDVYHYHVDDDHNGADLEFTDHDTRRPGRLHISAAQIDAMHTEIHRDDEGAGQ